MGKFYTANNELKDYLVGLGFPFHDRGEDDGILYYTEHTTGKQVKINNNVNLITLIDPYGRIEDESTSFTDNQIVKFLDK